MTTNKDGVGWILYFGGDMPQHVIPLGDLINHVESADCSCRPTVIAKENIVVHHAADGREYFEANCNRSLLENPSA